MARKHNENCWTLKLEGGPEIQDGFKRSRPAIPYPPPYYRKKIGNEVHEWRLKEVQATAKVCIMKYEGVVSGEGILDVQVR